jgi:hypothetical protein
MYNENALWAAWLESRPGGGPQEYKRFKEWLASIKGETYYTAQPEKPKPVPRDTPPDAEAEIARARAIGSNLIKLIKGGTIFYSYENAQAMKDAYESAFSALRAQSWTDEDMFAAAVRGTSPPDDGWRRWLASHRKQKTAFDPGKEVGGEG